MNDFTFIGGALAIAGVIVVGAWLWIVAVSHVALWLS